MRRIGAFIVLMLLAATGHAQTQVDRISATTITNRGIIVFQSGATPSVALGNVFQTNSNGSITNLLNGTKSQQVWVICADAGTAIESGGGIITIGGTLNCTVNTIFSFIFNGTNWLQSAATTGGGGGTTTPGLPNNSIQVGVGGVFTGDSHLLWVPSSGLAVTGGGAYTHSILSGTNGFNGLSVQPAAVTLTSRETGAGIAFSSFANTSFTVGSANPFNLPIASGAAGTVLMTNGANPQVTSWSNDFTKGLNATIGTLTTDVNPFNLTFAYNNAAQVFNGVKWTATNTAYAAGSYDYQFCGGASGTACLTVDPVGRVSAPNQVGSGDGSAAGNLEMAAGPLPSVLAGNVGFTAPVTVSSAFLISLPSAPCAGVLGIYSVSTNYGTMRCSADAANSASATAQTASISAFTLCSAANCPAGEYRIDVHANSTQVCADATGATLAFATTYTDGAGTKTAQAIPLVVNGAASLSATESLGDTTHTGYGYALVGSTGINPIQLSLTLAGCATGTAQYSYTATVTRLR